MTAYICVTASELSPESALWSRIGPADFLDCYSVRARATPRRAAEIITSFPGWARFLLVIRRLLTSPFGLSNDGPMAVDKVGAFPVESETDTELIAGFDDKHLDFRVSIVAQDGQVSLATWVHVHNPGGTFYLNAILPFHILIARDALRRVAVETAAPSRK
ncbi:MAG: DUF2867 domain-containing protein [Pseudomonadota bacterium]